MMIPLVKYLLLSLGLTLTYSSFAQSIVLNKGVAGNNSKDLIARMDQDVLAESPDLVIIMVGTNDMLNSRKLLSYEQYKGNYERVIEKLKAKEIEVVLMSPPPVDEEYVLKRHDPAQFTVPLNEKIDAVGSLAKALAQQHSLHFIDLNQSFKSMGSPSRDSTSLLINPENYGLEDGIHPTEQGYAYMAQVIFAYLKKNRLLEKDKKIICFGDSMTYGSYMSGAGTSEGGTYPSFLALLINN